MDTADLKKLLIKSKSDPVKCAVGVGKDGTAQIILHKMKAGTSLVKELENEAGKVEKTAFGTAMVDTDTDPKLVILTLNKVGGGGAAKLKKALKGTGFTKVEIRFEDGSVAESVGEEESEAQGQEAPPTAAAAPEPQAAPAAPDAAPTIASLQATMPALIKQVQEAMAADPARGATLKPLAAAAIAAVKGQDVAAANQAIAALQAGLAAGAPAAGAAAAPPAPPPPPSQIKAIQAEFAKLVPTFAGAAGTDKGKMDTLRALAAEVAAALKAGNETDAATGLAKIKDLLPPAGATAAPAAGGAKLIDIWRDAKESVDEGISALQKACRNHPSEDLRSLLAEVADKGLNGVTDRASVGMIAAMMEAEKSPETRAKAQKAVAQMRAFLKTPQAANIDENPFNVKVDLVGTLGAALDKIEARPAA